MKKTEFVADEDGLCLLSQPRATRKHRRGRWYRIANLIIAFALGALLFLLYLAEIRQTPNAEEGGEVFLFGIRVPETCLYRRILDRPCLGCGLTHGIVSLLDGNSHEAYRLHPSAVWVTVWMAAQMTLRLLLVLSPSRFFPSLLSDLSVSLATMVVSIYLPIAW